MNIWIARLGNENFNDTDLLEIKKITNECGLNSENVYRYTSHLVDYISFFTEKEKTNKTYNHEQGYLRAYSGLLASNTGCGTDFRHAKSLFMKTSLTEIATELAGQFALIEVDKNKFRCAIDAIGNHKVFYFTAADGTCYVTNYIHFLRPLKKKEINYQFLVDFIANGGTYGIESEEKDVFLIPASSELVWAKGSGLNINQYYSLDQMLNPEELSEISYKKVAEHFQNVAEYLASHHNLIVPLSGGYDSRMILKMFSERDLKSINTFTYPDHQYDLYLAKKIANSKHLQHIVLEVGDDIQTVDKLHRRAVDNYPFMSYSGLKSHQQKKEELNIQDWDKVHIRGNTAAHAVIKKLDYINISDGEKAIRMLAENRINSKILTGFGRENSIKNFETNYKEKYLDLYAQGKIVELSKIHFIYEKFGNHQGYRYSFSRTKNPEDLYFPFADRIFLKLILSSDVDTYIKEKYNSIHQKLYSQLNNCVIKQFPFTTGPHWDASKMEKKLFKIRNKHWKRVLTKIGIDKKKLSRKKQVEFIHSNLSSFEEIVHSYPKSGLWDYIDRDIFIYWLSSKELAMKNLKPIQRVLPYLKIGI